MRLWSIDLQYLDAKGLVALWREALLAKHVLEGKTKGYKNHPQLDRFKKQTSPQNAINYYLSLVCKEAKRRGYNFDENKIAPHKKIQIKVTAGQLEYEFAHLLNKLKIRDPEKFKTLQEIEPKQNQAFKVIDGEIESWEKI